MSKGSLFVVGTGIQLAGHVTVETKRIIKQADKVFFLVNGRASAHWVCQLNETAESLAPFYTPSKRRLDSYLEMVDTILAAVCQQQQVCVVFYGHPGVFVFPAHEVIRRTRQAGYTAMMLPGISAEDCLFADVGIDPARYGCQSFEATDFLIRPRQFDKSTGLILWQIGVVGNLGIHQNGHAQPGLAILAEWLLSHYNPHHEVILYEAAYYPVHSPRIQRLPLDQLSQAQVTAVTTLYIPPVAEAKLDTQMVRRLGLTPEALYWQRP